MKADDKIDLSLSDTFPGRTRIELEIGPGRGMYVMGRAAEDPGAGFLAIEVRSRFARLIEERARKRGLDNLVVIHGDARRYLCAARPDGCLERVSVHFPDPWWKKRHMKRAVLDRASLEHIVRLLRVQGEIYVQTDVFDRATRLLRLFTDHEGLENASAGGGLLEGSPFSSVSNRERTCMEAGLPVFRMLFRKKGP